MYRLALWRNDRLNFLELPALLIYFVAFLLVLRRLGRPVLQGGAPTEHQKTRRSKRAVGVFWGSASQGALIFGHGPQATWLHNVSKAELQSSISEPYLNHVQRRAPNAATRRTDGWAHGSL